MLFQTFFSKEYGILKINVSVFVHTMKVNGVQTAVNVVQNIVFCISWFSDSFTAVSMIERVISSSAAGLCFVSTVTALCLSLCYLTAEREKKLNWHL